MPTSRLAGADVPGFGAILRIATSSGTSPITGRSTIQLVNEFRFTYNREGQGTFQHPQNTISVQNSCPPAPLAALPVLYQCFYGDRTPGNATGIHPFLGAGMRAFPSSPSRVVFHFGNNAEGEIPQVGNSFQWSDNMTKVPGNHTMKFGADIRRQRFDQTLYYNVNGSFSIRAAVRTMRQSRNTYIRITCSDLPDTTARARPKRRTSATPIFICLRKIAGRSRPNLTLNYGLRWELNTPLADISRHVQTFRPGQSSTDYPLWR